MAIKINISDDAPRATERVLLKAKKTIDGNVMVSDHPDVDILVMNEKIIALPKDEMDDEIYETQNRLFKFLTKNGIVEHDSIQGGNLFMSVEAKMPEAKKGESLQYALYVIAEFMDKELPYYETMDKFKAEMEDRLLEPEIDEYTELDPEKYHAEKKGSLRPQMRPYGISTIYRI